SFDVSQRRSYGWFTRLHHQRHHVKIKEAILRIKNFNVVADRPGALSQRSPIKPSDAFIKPFADCFAPLESKKAASRVIQVSDSAFGVSYDDAFLNRVENGFQETFLLRQTQKIVLHVFRPDSAQALDEFF